MFRVIWGAVKTVALAFLSIQQGLFSSGKTLSFDLWQSATVIISALFHRVWSQFFQPCPSHVLPHRHTHTHTHTLLPLETYSSLLLLRQVHYKHRLLGNTQTERNFWGKLKLFGLVQFPISIMAKVMRPVSQSYNCCV